MNLVKNVQFSRQIKAPDRPREFNFRIHFGNPATICQIDVGDEKGNRHYFSMQLLDSQWKIRETTVANWILVAEPLLHAAIVEQESIIRHKS